MSLVEFLSGPLAQLWAQALLHFLWQGAVIAVGVFLLLQLARVTSASARYAVCLTGLMLMAACPSITLAVLWSTSPAESNPSFAEPTIISDVVAHQADLERDVAKQQAAGNVFSFDAISSERARWWILAVWTSGVILMAVRLVTSWIGTVLIIRRRTPLAVSRLRELTARLAAQLNITRIPQVCASHLVNDATAVGFWRPLILLPAAWVTELSPDMLEAVLAHELAHIRRYDLWWNLFQRVVETVLFYHPAVWWLSRRVRAERECCCDELAVSATHQRLVYATTLEYVARERTGLVRPLVAVTLGDSRMALLKRIRNVLGLTPSTGGGGWGAIALLSIAIPVTFWLMAEAEVRPLQADDDKRPVETDRIERNVSKAQIQFSHENAEDAANELKKLFADRKPTESPVITLNKEAKSVSISGTREQIAESRSILSKYMPGDLVGDLFALQERREAERREGVRPNPERREGDRRPGEGGPRPEARPGERRVEESRTERREGDRRIVEEHRREESGSGERREGQGPRPGDRPQGDRGPIGPGPFHPGERGPQPNREGNHPPVMQEMHEMMRTMQDLRREIEQLRREVQELKSQRPQGPGGMGNGFGRGMMEGRGGFGGGFGEGRGGFGGESSGPGRPGQPRGGEGRPGLPGAAPREGDRPQGPPNGPRDGDRPQAGPRDGDRPQGPGAGPRDGDRPQNGPRGPREGDRPQGPPNGPRDGDRPQAGPRDGDRPQGSPRVPGGGDRPQNPPREGGRREEDRGSEAGESESASVTIRGILPKLSPDVAVNILNLLTSEANEEGSPIDSVAIPANLPQ